MGTCRAFSRITRASPAISSTVSPFRRRAVRNAPSCEGVASPVMISSITAAASTSVSDWPAATCAMASLIIVCFPSLSVDASSGVLIHPRQKIAQQVFTGACQNRLWMKLHALHRIVPMTHCHNQPIVGFGSDFQFGGQARPLNDQTMIAHRFERLRQSGQHTPPLMSNTREFTVHRDRRANDAPAIDLAHALMPQADAQDGRRLPKGQNDIVADACLVGRAGSGRDDDARRDRKST